jgi:hypothetical protein
MKILIKPSDERSLDNLRPCVKSIFDGGVAAGIEFSKLAYRLIFELNRLGYSPLEIKELLLDSNKRSGKPFNVGDQIRCVDGFVDWFFRAPKKLSCDGLKDYCLGKSKCWFHHKRNYLVRRSIEKMPFDIGKLETYLGEWYKKDSYLMILILKAMRQFQQSKATGEVMFISLRIILNSIRDKYKHTLSPTQISRAIFQLMDIGVIALIEKGKQGSCSGSANGYKFLTWEPPHDGSVDAKA